MSEQGPHEKRLLNALLNSYNTLERPVANESEPLEVKFGLTLQQIIDVVSDHFLSSLTHQYDDFVCGGRVLKLCLNTSLVFPDVEIL